MDKSKGIITSINHEKNFGFIREQKTNEEIFFHTSGVIEPPFKDLREGHEVVFMKLKYSKGKEQKEHNKAIGVEVIFSL